MNLGAVRIAVKTFALAFSVIHFACSTATAQGDARNDRSGFYIGSMPASSTRPARAESAVASAAMRPAVAGALHEAFLSPSKNKSPFYLDIPPPDRIHEFPGIAPPDGKASWIPGYWEYDQVHKDYLWTTGTWRLPPPGRFWVNGYWKSDGTGWYRVQGFWSDRPVEQIAWRKLGPPARGQIDTIGHSPSNDHFYIPSHYAPASDGVTWVQGYWSKTQPGWSWVPAQWVRQPEGWLFQEGYWDRTLEDRGMVFAALEVSPTKRAQGLLMYAPTDPIPPAEYGQVYGVFGRVSSTYDGYSGFFFAANGRCFISPEYGRIDRRGQSIDASGLATVLAAPLHRANLVTAGQRYKSSDVVTKPNPFSQKVDSATGVTTTNVPPYAQYVTPNPNYGYLDQAASGLNHALNAHQLVTAATFQGSGGGNGFDYNGVGVVIDTTSRVFRYHDVEQRRRAGLLTDRQAATTQNKIIAGGIAGNMGSLGAVAFAESCGVIGAAGGPVGVAAGLVIGYVAYEVCEGIAEAIVDVIEGN